MNPSTEISPSTKLFLNELHKLFHEYEARWDRRFAELDNTWHVTPAAPDLPVQIPSSPVQIASPPLIVKQDNARATSGVVSVPIHAAAVDTDVVADNWGGFFDGGVVSSEPPPSITADNWDGLFEQPTHIVEEHIPDLSGPNISPAPSAIWSTHRLDLSAVVVFPVLASTDQICLDNPSKIPGLASSNRFTSVDRTDEQYFYWCYADPRCFVPLLGHRPPCGRPPPHSELYCMDATDSTRLDLPSPPAPLLDAGDPMERIHLDIFAAVADNREVPFLDPKLIGGLDAAVRPRSGVVAVAGLDDTAACDVPMATHASSQRVITPLNLEADVSFMCLMECLCTSIVIGPLVSLGLGNHYLLEELSRSQGSFTIGGISLFMSGYLMSGQVYEDCSLKISTVVLLLGTCVKKNTHIDGKLLDRELIAHAMFYMDYTCYVSCIGCIDTGGANCMVVLQLSLERCMVGKPALVMVKARHVAVDLRPITWPSFWYF